MTSLDYAEKKADKKLEWCSHIKVDRHYNQAIWILNPVNYFEVDDEQQKVSCDWDYCPICGKKRP